MMGRKCYRTRVGNTAGNLRPPRVLTAPTGRNRLLLGLERSWFAEQRGEPRSVIQRQSLIAPTDMGTSDVRICAFRVVFALFGCLLCFLAAGGYAWAADMALVDFRVDGNTIKTPLTAEPGDPMRGREVVLSRETGNCFLCHAIPDPGETRVGNIGPPLAGVGSRLNAAQLRLRLVDSTRVNRATVMPLVLSNHRIESGRIDV
jgi:hypothetical protein